MAENQTINQEKMPHEDYFVVLSIHNPQFATYLIVSSLLILKMCGLTLLTIFYRQTYKVYMSDEDAKMYGGIVGSHAAVDRVKRAVLNNLENIPVFLVIGLAYLFVGVPDWVVHFLFYLFLIARALYSVVYAVYVVPQPTRTICFFIGFFITVYLSFHVLVYGIFVGYLGK